MENIEQKLSELKTALEAATEKKMKEAIRAEIKALEEKIPSVDELKTGIEDIKQWQVKKDEADKKNQEALDSLIAGQSKRKTEKKSFVDAFAEAVENNFDNIKKVRKGESFKMEVKAVGNMTLGANLTGDSVATYSARQAILPSTKVNFRDIIPSTASNTLLYVQYRESAGEGGIAVQTEGAAKGQIDFDFSEVKIVNDYIAGFVRFSKQMTKALPWMQTTLPRLLLREFYSGTNGENNTFFSTVSAAATGSTTTAETDDVKQIIDYIANQRTAKFAASFGLVSHTQMARLNKLTYTNGYYSGSGGVLTRVDGSMEISGVPIIPVDWVTDDKILILDRDYIERVEAETLTVEFFEQDSDNVQKNLITARIECLEDINLMLPSSAIYADLGNVA